MKVCIAGGGKVGMYLAQSLLAHRHKVTIIEPQEMLCRHSTGRPERTGERRSGMGAPGAVQGPQHHHGAAHHRGAHRSGPCTQPH